VLDRRGKPRRLIKQREFIRLLGCGKSKFFEMKRKRLPRWPGEHLLDGEIRYYEDQCAAFMASLPPKPPPRVIARR
jgi:hypothetical protein